MSQSWPQDQTDTLTRLWVAGSSAGAICQQLGVTRNSVMGKVSRLGLQRNRQVDYVPHVRRQIDFRPRVSKPKDQKPPTPLKVQAQTPHPVPFLDADHTTCKWPLWSGPRTGLVCGATPIPTKPYCVHHYDKAFVELWSRRKAC